MDMTLWHNPRCSKSRQALALLQAAGHAPKVRPMPSDPPSEDELRAALRLLGMTPAQLMRTNEARAHGVSPDDSDDSDDNSLIAAMVAHPILIERPILFANGKAIVGRPPENILTIL